MDGFEILSKLGDGSYSVVYKVKRKEDGNIYALKKVKLQKLSEKEKENSINEVRILASVKSAFVVSYKEAFIDENDKSLCLIMEYADKGDLFQKISQFKKMKYLIEEVDVWRIFIQMTKGLKALHDLKILHRDLKSANIFLFSDGSAKIGDLNVSKVVHKGLGYTQTGTPYYASPEVWKDQPYDSKSDIWSLACVTYEMLTLHPPFRAESMEGLYNKVIKGQYSKICDRYSNDMSELLKLLFKVNPCDRPSCDQILKNPIVKKRIEFFQAEAGNPLEDLDNIDENVLLRTIRIPKNILNLAEKLPGANYNTPKNKMHMLQIKNNIVNTTNSNTKSTNSSLPDIKTKTGSKKDEWVLSEDKRKNDAVKVIKNNNYKIAITSENSNNATEKSKKILINENNKQNDNDKNNLKEQGNKIELPVHKKYKGNNNNQSKEIHKYVINLGNDVYNTKKTNKSTSKNKLLNNINYDDYIKSIQQNKKNNFSSRVIPNKKLNPLVMKNHYYIQNK